MKKWILFAVLVAALNVKAGELKGVTMADKMSVDGQEFLLNSMGLRRVKKFGFPVKVYVAGLYLTKKSSKETEIIDSKSTKWLIMEFVRNVDRTPLIDSWKKAINRLCDKNCDESKAKLKEFNKAMVNVRAGHQFKIGFFPDRVFIEVLARENKKVTVTSKIFVKDMLSVFIGPKPADKGLKKGLLGI